MNTIEQIQHYKLSSRMKQTIVSVILWGLMAHLYIYTNRIVNHDAVWKLKYSGSTVTSGRWFLHVLVQIAYRFNNNYVTPWGIGFLTIGLYAVCGCILVKALDIRNKALCCLLGALLVTYPTVTSTNLYIFTAHYYAVSFLLACASVLLLVMSEKPIAILLSSIMIACSLGIYQAYIPFILSMYVLLIMLKCLRPGASTPDIIKTALRFLAALIGGLVIYFALNRVFLKLTNSQMDTYMGLDQMGRLDIASLPALLGKCYSSFVELFLRHYHGINHKPWIRIVMLLCCLFSVAATVYGIRKNRVSALHIVFLCIALLIFPIAIGSIYIMVQTERTICTMTVYATIFIFIVPICLADKLFSNLSIRKTFIVHLCLCVALGFVSLYYSILANETYLALEYSNQNVNAYFTELVTQIKSLDGFSTDLEVALLGENQDDSIPEIDYDYIIRGNFTPSELINVYSRQHFMTMHCGYSCTFVEDPDAWSADERVQAMPAYPSPGSIQIIDGVIVVKFS